jgi:CheY-like chemotaxis protein
MTAATRNKAPGQAERNKADRALFGVPNGRNEIGPNARRGAGDPDGRPSTPGRGSSSASHLPLILASSGAATLSLMRVLLVEGKVKLASLLRPALRGEGVAVDLVLTGEDALWMAGATRYDAIVLDVMLPGMDGIETCRRLRADGIWTPVLMLAARGRLADRVAGLDGGADDYLAKPVELPELMVRLRALVRREPVRRPTVLEVGDLRPDPGPDRSGASAKRCSSPPGASRCWRRSCASPASRCPAISCSKRPGTATTTIAPTWSISTSAPYASASTSHSDGTASRLSRVAAIACARMAGSETAPVRWRLTLAFAVVIAVVLAATGLFVY